MKILMYIPNLKGGGAEKVFINLANYFSVQQGIKVILCTSTIGNQYLIHLLPSVELIEIKRNKLRVFNFPFLIYQLIGILKVERPEVYFTTLNRGNVAGYISLKISRLRSKLILRQANVLGFKRMNFFLSILLKRSFRNSDLVIANSHDTKKAIVNFAKLDSSKVVVIGNPVISQYELLANLNSHNISINKKYIISIGSLSKQKRHDILINAFHLISDKIENNLIILGEGKLRSSLEQQITDLKLNNRVMLVGFKGNPEHYLQQSKVFVLSSSFEGFGNVIVEALAYGLPIVSTNCQGGPKYILEDGKYGDIVPLNDVGALADAIMLNLLSDRFKSTDQIKRALDFSIENIGAKYLEVLSI